MCACGCFLLAAVVAALVYTVMHGLWLLTAAVLIAAVLIGWFGKKMASLQKRAQRTPPVR